MRLLRFPIEISNIDVIVNPTGFSIYLAGTVIAYSTSTLPKAEAATLRHLRSNSSLREAHRQPRSPTLHRPLSLGFREFRNQSFAAPTWRGPVRRERSQGSEADVNLFQLSLASGLRRRRHQLDAHCVGSRPQRVGLGFWDLHHRYILGCHSLCLWIASLPASDC